MLESWKVGISSGTGFRQLVSIRRHPAVAADKRWPERAGVDRTTAVDAQDVALRRYPIPGTLLLLGVFVSLFL